MKTKQKIGIFGGSFNPPHVGHTNLVETVAKKIGLDFVYIIPAYQNPLKVKIDGPTPEQRLTMTQLAFQDLGEKFVVSDLEINRKGTSYTIDTINDLKNKHPEADLFLILGADNFELFSDWKDPKKILENCNLIIASRPGWEVPTEKAELPDFFQKITADFDFNFVELKYGTSVQFLKLKDIEISAQEIRKWVRIGKNVDKYLPLAVERYIADNKIYASLGSKIPDYKKFTEFCAQVLFDRKAIQVRAFDLRQLSAPTEFSLVASGTSTRHATALGENIMMAVKEEFNVYPQSVEGTDEGRWVLLDYGSLIIHLFYDFVRQEYSLEKLWQDGVDLKLVDNSARSK